MAYLVTQRGRPDNVAADDATTGSSVFGAGRQLQVVPQWTLGPVEVAVSAGSVTSVQLSAGLHHIISDTACYFLQGGSGVTATSSSYYLPADQERLLYVDDVDDSGYVAVIQSTASGTLQISHLSSTV